MRKWTQSHTHLPIRIEENSLAAPYSSLSTPTGNASQPQLEPIQAVTPEMMSQLQEMLQTVVCDSVKFELGRLIDE